MSWHLAKEKTRFNERKKTSVQEKREKNFNTKKTYILIFNDSSILANPECDLALKLKRAERREFFTTGNYLFAQKKVVDQNDTSDGYLEEKREICCESLSTKRLLC